jgi:surface antigen
MDLLRTTVRELLESGEVGAEREWENPETGHGGRATLLRVFSMEKRPCGRVEQEMRGSNGTHHRTFDICKQADGSWKIVR